MPIYDYVCRNCGHVLEVIHGVHDAGPSACPVCGGPMRRAVSAAAVHFKGSGWAKKERSSKPGGPAKESGEPAKAGAESGKSGGQAGKSGGESGKSAADASATTPRDSTKSSSSSSSEAS